MTWGKSPTESSGYRVLNDPFGHQKYFQPPTARNRPFWAFFRQISHFLYIFNIGRQDPVFGKIGIKSAGGAPDRNFWRPPMKYVVLSPKTFWGLSGRFPADSAVFSKIDPRKSRHREKSRFFDFLKIEFFRKITQKFLRGGPDFLSKSHVLITVPYGSLQSIFQQKFIEIDL